MNWITVDSTYLNALAYDGDTYTLSVEFADGTQWQYAGVPEAVFNNMLGAPSIGRAYLKTVKGRYSGGRVT